MPPPERRFAVSLQGRRVGILHAKGDTTWFVLDREYIEDPERAVLGLRFEEDLRARHRATKLLPPWFSNLLPEGSLRDWIAVQRGVRVEREIELLAEVGHDLPGAVVIAPTEEHAAPVSPREVVANPPDLGPHAWRFSLAGVQMKFSMLAKGERFTVPASGEDGDWIIKLPDPGAPGGSFIVGYGYADPQLPAYPYETMFYAAGSLSEPGVLTPLSQLFSDEFIPSRIKWDDGALALHAEGGAWDFVGGALRPGHA